MIEPGKYLAHARKVSFGESKTGNTQIAVDFEFESGDVMSWTGTFTEKATPIAVKALRAMGWGGDDLSELDGCDTAEFLPEQVELVVDIESYEGKTYTRIKYVNRPGSGTLQFQKPVTGNDLKTFAARMKSLIKAVGGNRTEPKESIPF